MLIILIYGADTGVVVSIHALFLHYLVNVKRGQLLLTCKKYFSVNITQVKKIISDNDSEIKNRDSERKLLGNY